MLAELVENEKRAVPDPLMNRRLMAEVNNGGGERAKLEAREFQISRVDRDDTARCCPYCGLYAPVLQSNSINLTNNSTRSPSRVHNETDHPAFSVWPRVLHAEQTQLPN